MRRYVLAALGALCLAGGAGTAAAAPAAPADDEKEGVIAGTPIKRTDGDGWLGLDLGDGGGFRLTFYNAKKKPTAADRTSAIMRWSVRYQPNPERTELLPTDNPDVLASAYPVRAPYGFLLHITLLKEGSDLTEAYVITFKG